MPLGIEKYLGMHDIVGLAAQQVRPGQVVKVPLCYEHGHALVVEVEKILQAIKPVRIPDSGDIRIGQVTRCAEPVRINSGSRLPSMWICSSALGRSAINCLRASMVFPSSIGLPG
jgi:hypothetical protein